MASLWIFLLCTILKTNVLCRRRALEGKHESSSAYHPLLRCANQRTHQVSSGVKGFLHHQRGT